MSGPEGGGAKGLMRAMLPEVSAVPSAPATVRTEPCAPLQRHQGHQPASLGAMVDSAVTCLSAHRKTGLWPLFSKNPKSHA